MPHNKHTTAIIKTGRDGEDTKLDLKISSWQQRVSDSDLPTGGFSWSQDERLPKGRSTQDESQSAISDLFNSFLEP